jgi:D-erythronate 2-dehydrogenase
VVGLIDRVPDETIARIVSGWPRNFDAHRARDLGFEAEARFTDILQVHIADELGGKIAA